MATFPCRRTHLLFRWPQFLDPQQTGPVSCQVIGFAEHLTQMIGEDQLRRQQFMQSVAVAPAAFGSRPLGLPALKPHLRSNGDYSINFARNPYNNRLL
jgi:hypothetical protein